MSTKRRLSSEESKARAVEEARTLLIDSGPQAVTLKAVADRVGRTHANLLHHFGSAAGLQKELASHLADTVCASIRAAILQYRAGDKDPREVIDMIFDAFDKEGGGALANWMLASGNMDAIHPIVDEIHKVIDELYPEELSGTPPQMHRVTYTLCLIALGDALLGPSLATGLGVERSTSRDHAEQMLMATLALTGRLKP